MLLRVGRQMMLLMMIMPGIRDAESEAEADAESMLMLVMLYKVIF